MAESLGFALATFVLLVVGFGLRWVVLRFVGARDVAALPEPTERFEYLAEVRQMRGDGASLQDCIQHLRSYGLRAGVARGLVLDMEREQPAAIESPREGEWRGYRFSYPGNWRVMPLVPEAGSEPGISIDGIGSAIFMLIGLEENETIQEITDGFEEQLEGGDRSNFGGWGGLHGEGTHFAGPHGKFRLQVEASIFKPQHVEVPFLLMHMHAVEEAELVTPGFELIRETFRRDDSA